MVAPLMACVCYWFEDDELIGGRSKISSILGSSSPPAVRSIVCQVNEFASTGFITLIIVAVRPSGSVPRLRMNQRPPRCSQVASANVPLESNVQERIAFAAGSQPMICIPEKLSSSIGNLEGPREEVLVLRPVAIDLDLGVVRVGGPIADHPFQRLELLIVRRRDFLGFVRHAVEQPFAVALDIDGRVFDLLGLRIRATAILAVPCSMATLGETN